MEEEKSYELTIELYGFPAYAIKKLLETGLYGRTKEEVASRLITSHLEEKLEFLSRRGITIDEAEKEGYIPAELKDLIE